MHPSKTTVKLALSPGDWARVIRARVAALEDPWFAVTGFASSLAGLALLVGGVTFAPTPPAPVVILRATPSLAVPTAAPETLTVAWQGPTFGAAVVAYDAPGGAPIGAIEPGRAYSPIALHGNAWLLADVQGSGQVWLRVSEAGLPPGPALPDLAPTPTPPAPVIEVIYVSLPAPAAPAVAEAAPAPTPGWQGVPYAVDYAPPPACPLMLSPDQLAACEAAEGGAQ